MSVKRRISPLTLVILLFLIALLAQQAEYNHFSCRRIIPAKFRTFKIHLPYGYDIHGIDISKYQTDIDWQLLSKAKQGKNKITFAFIKATQGTQRIDPCFRTNWSEAPKHKIIRGAYHYFEPNGSPELQAKHFCKQVQLKPGDLPPVLDAEELGKNSRKELQKRVKTWLEIVEKHYKVKPILYVPARFYTDILESQFNAYPIWIAHYYKYKLPESLPWMFWQHSDKGRVPGIKGPVDFNVFRGSREEFKALLVRHP